MAGIVAENERWRVTADLGKKTIEFYDKTAGTVPYRLVGPGADTIAAEVRGLTPEDLGRYVNRKLEEAERAYEEEYGGEG